MTENKSLVERAMESKPFSKQKITYSPEMLNLVIEWLNCKISCAEFAHVVFKNRKKHYAVHVHAFKIMKIALYRGDISIVKTKKP